jgi:HNH endonuclease
VLRVGFVTGSDREHDVDGVGAPSTSPILGEPYAQLPKVGRSIYINHPDWGQLPTMREGDPPTINQPASKPRHFHQGTCSLTDAHQDDLAEVEVTIEPFDPLDERDGRERVLATLVRRRGQAEFRRELLRAYRSRCAISGCPVEDVLEAAHIKAYRGEHTNHVTNGLLLRADLHVLFDLYLIAIEPGSDSYSVIIDPGLASTPYGQFDGQKLLLPEARSQWPDAGCLRSRPHAWLRPRGP